VCFDMQRNGVCKRGSSCLYSHDRDAIARAPPLPPLKARSELSGGPSVVCALAVVLLAMGLMCAPSFFSSRRHRHFDPRRLGTSPSQPPWHRVSLLATLWGLWPWWVWTKSCRTSSCTQDLIEALPLPCR
jgi:hypothetical protein